MSSSIHGFIRALDPVELTKLHMVPVSLMRGAGIEPIHAARKPMPVVPKRAIQDGKFHIDESGLTLTHVHVLEAVLLSAFSGAEYTSGELELHFKPGDALRAMGITDGNRGWLLARLKELGSTIGNQPRSMASAGGDFSIMRTMTTDTPSTKSVCNVITGIDAGGLVHEAVKAKIWTVRLSAGYRAWLESDTSVRHTWLPQLRALKSGAAEAVARYALSGNCNIPLPKLLLDLGVIEAGWDMDTNGAGRAYRTARRAIDKILSLVPALEAMGIKVTKGSDGVIHVIAESMNPGMRFFKKATATVAHGALCVPATPITPLVGQSPTPAKSKFAAIAERLAASRRA